MVSLARKLLIITCRAIGADVLAAEKATPRYPAENRAQGETLDLAGNVTRQVSKSAAGQCCWNTALATSSMLSHRCIGKRHLARLLTLPVEGRVVHGSEGLDVGNRVRVHLISVEVGREKVRLGNPKP